MPFIKGHFIFQSGLCCKKAHEQHTWCLRAPLLSEAGGTRAIRPPCVWIMTAGFTGRCRGDEERRALAHATQRRLMGSGSYDNNDKLGLTGRHDDGPPRTLRRAARPRRREGRPIWMPTGARASGGSFGSNMASVKFPFERHETYHASASCQHPILKKKKKKKKSREKCPPNPPGWRVGGGLRQIHTVIQMVRTLRPRHKQDYYPNKFSHS